MIPGLQEAISRNQSLLREMLSESKSHIIIPVFPADASLVDEYVEVSNVMLTKRQYAMPAPWAVREYMYLANVWVHSSEPETPLVFGEWKHWYRYPSWAQPEIPPHEDRFWL